MIKTVNSCPVVVQHFNQNFKLEFASHFYLPLLKFKPRMGKKIPPHNESFLRSGSSVVPTGLVPACLHRFFTGKSCLAAKGDRETSSLPCGDRLAPKTGKQDYTYLRSFGLQTLTDFFLLTFVFSSFCCPLHYFIQFVCPASPLEFFKCVRKAQGYVRDGAWLRSVRVHTIHHTKRQQRQLQTTREQVF